MREVEGHYARLDVKESCVRNFVLTLEAPLKMKNEGKWDQEEDNTKSMVIKLKITQSE